MPTSFAEQARLTCPNCQSAVSAEVWSLVDAAERPDLAAELRDGALNLVTCPSCGAQFTANAALLFHDPATRRVYFAVPADVGEHIWREQAQALLYALVGSLPEEQQLPYLGDVQLEQEQAGVRRAVLRRERGRRSSGAPPVGRSVESVLGALPVSQPAPAARAPARPAPAAAPAGALVAAVQSLLAADNQAEFDAILAAEPELLTDAGDATIQQLVELAYGQGERAIADALRELRSGLGRLRRGEPAIAPEPASAAPAAELAAGPPEQIAPEPAALPDAAYQALLLVASPAALAEAARSYPVLLEGWADDALLARAEAALDEGNERLAQAIEDRREALAELREQASEPAALLQALRALMQATGDDDAVAAALLEHPMLLTDAAQAALPELAGLARASGDAALAEYALACRALLHKVRAGLDAG